MSPRPSHDSSRGPNLNGMILLSVLLHALFLSIFLLSPALPAKKWTFGPVYSVDLVSFPADLSPSRASQTTVPMARELESVQAKKHTLDIKKTEERQSMLSLKQQVSLRNESDDKLKKEKAIEDVKKRIAAASAEKKADNKQIPPRSSIASASPQEASGETNARVLAYYTTIWARIREQWALPRGILPEHNLLAVINIVILRDGTLSGLSFEKGSGNKYFDQSAARAVRKASPFPPLPDWVRDPNMEIGIRFSSKDFR